MNKVNNMKKKAKENFESNLDNIVLDNSTNPKTYWKIMKMLMVYDDDKKCELLNKYFYG
jgi:hypothetical protein